MRAQNEVIVDRLELTHDPHRRVHIVTCSTDDDLPHGSMDFAIGWFREKNDLTASIRAILRHRWTGNCRWNVVISSGIVSEALAKDWAKRIAWDTEE